MNIRLTEELIRLIFRSMSTDGNGWLGSWISAAFAMIVTTTN